MNPTIKRTLNQWRNGPYITYSLIAIQTIVFLLNYLLPSLQLQEKGVMFGPFVAYYHQYWRFITPIFLHFGFQYVNLWDFWGIFDFGRLFSPQSGDSRHGPTICAVCPFKSSLWHV